LAGQQQRHPACKKNWVLGVGVGWFVGGDDLIGALHVSICHHHLNHPKLQQYPQNGDILILANPGLPGKWLLKWRDYRNRGK